MHPFVIINEISTSIQNKLSFMYLDTSYMMRRMAMNKINPSLIY